MRVTLIAHTWQTMAALELQTELGMSDNGGHSAEQLIEFAGRNCYQSWNNPGAKTNREYITNLLNHGHGSVLEHASATFFVTGISRSLTHELIRHRHLSFSELSQRYVNVEDAEFIYPPAATNQETYVVDLVTATAQEAYRSLVKRFEDRGLPRKQAREAARSVLPNCIETKLVVTGNFRAWRGVIDQRATEYADAEIRAFAVEVCRQLQERFPACFGDYVIENGIARTEWRKV